MEPDRKATDELRPRWLVRLDAALSPWQRPFANAVWLEPMVVARELAAWANDDGRWRQVNQGDMHALLDDAIASWERLGPRLQSAAETGQSVASLRGVAGKSRISSAERDVVREAAESLLVAFKRANTLTASLDDVFEAAQAEIRPDSLAPEAEWRLAILASVAEEQDNDWAIVARRLRSAFQADATASLTERLALARRALETAPGSGHSVVWLCINHASSWGVSPNPAVQLYDGDWVLAVLENWSGPRADVPPELAADRETLLGSWSRLKNDAADDDVLPVVFARIDLGEGPTAGARERARDTLELLIARAAILQGGTNWRLSDLVIHYVDGEAVYTSTGPIGYPDIYDRLTRSEVIGDETGGWVKREADRLRGHIPVTDHRMHAALSLAQWLVHARGTPAPARLVLGGRILEQCAGWAAADEKAFALDYLLLPWCWRRVERALAYAGRAAILRMPGADGTSSSEQQREEFLELSRDVLETDSGRRPPLARPWRTLEVLDQLSAIHAPDGEIGATLSQLRVQLANGVAAADWIEEMCDEGRTRYARAKRTRNAIVHGGPLVPEIAAVVVGMLDTLARTALDWAIDALLNERPLDDYFTERRCAYVDALAALKHGAAPSEALPQPDSP